MVRRTARSGVDRRTFLSATTVIAASALSGCSDSDTQGSDGEDDAEDSSDRNDTGNSSEENGTQSSIETVEPPDEVDRYLEDANLYDGALVDMAGQDAIEVSVGAGEGGLAFDPPAARVSPDTEITWAWTGEGGAHNVVSEPDDHRGNESEGGEHGDDGGHGDHEHGGEMTLNSGEPETGEGITYSETLSETGTVLYHCHPHAEAGMKGAVVVEE